MLSGPLEMGSLVRLPEKATAAAATPAVPRASSTALLVTSGAEVESTALCAPQQRHITTVLRKDHDKYAQLPTSKRRLIENLDRFR